MQEATEQPPTGRVPMDKILSFIDECNSVDEETVMGWDDKAVGVGGDYPMPVTVLASSFNGSSLASAFGGYNAQTENLQIRR
jgi:hypothetical protein